jgi:hypothetical protein
MALSIPIPWYCASDRNDVLEGLLEALFWTRSAYQAGSSKSLHSPLASEIGLIGVEFRWRFR